MVCQTTCGRLHRCLHLKRHSKRSNSGNRITMQWQWTHFTWNVKFCNSSHRLNLNASFFTVFYCTARLNSTCASKTGFINVINNYNNNLLLGPALKRFSGTCQRGTFILFLEDKSREYDLTLHEHLSLNWRQNAQSEARM